MKIADSLRRADPLSAETKGAETDQPLHPKDTSRANVTPSHRPIEAALAHARNGYRVHPLRPRGKAPILPNWQQQATTDPEQIRKWWTEHPDANIGIVPGLSGLVVVDPDSGTDTKGNTKRGPQVWREWLARHGLEGEPTVNTPSGGEHWYFRTSTPVGNRTGILPNVDVKSDNGNIVAPGSVFSGRRYRARDGSANLPPVDSLPAIPEPLEALLTNPESAPRSSEPLGLAGVQTAVGRELRAVLNAKPGERNDTLNRAAYNLGQITGPAVSVELVQDLLAAAGEKIGLDPGEVFHTIRSGLEKGQQNPREVVAPEDERERRILREVETLEIRAEARRRYTQSQRPEAGQYDLALLGEVLTREPEPAPRIAELMAWESTTLISAQRKTGKTTLALNLVRSLLTGDPFLGRFRVVRLSGKVAILNFEVSAWQIANWAKEAGIDPDRLVLVNLRGRVNPFADESERAELARELRDLDVESLIVDPFGQAFSGDNQNDNSQVSPWLNQLQRFARTEVGARDLILVAHAGWGDAGRTRGASALEDWPDAIWRLTQKDSGQRYFSAVGRDVAHAEEGLAFDEVARSLVLNGDQQGPTGLGRLTDEQRDEELSQFLREHPGATSNEIHAGVPGRKTDRLATIRRLEESGRIEVCKDGPHRRHYLLPDQPAMVS